MKKIWNNYKNIPLIKKMVTAMILGVTIGIIFGEKAAVLEPFGNLFLTLLQMVALPLIMVNLMAGLSSLNDPKLFGNIGIKLLIYYLVTTIAAMFFAITVGTMVQPGIGFQLGGDYVLEMEGSPSIGAALLGMIPANVFKSLADGRLDQVVVFVAILGIATIFLPDNERERIQSICDILSRTFAKIMGAIMLYAPIGILSLMAKTFGQYGASMGGAIAKYIVSVYITVGFMIAFYLIILFVFTKIKPGYFFKNAAPVIISAASTCSSIATLPVSLQAADDFGVPKGIYSFSIPLGNQLNRDGMGIFFVTSFLFTAQAAGINFPPSALLQMVFLALILTLGGGGIPGGAMVFLALILKNFDLPVEIVGIIAGVHTLNEMGLTTLNCLGDLVGTIVVTFSGKKEAVAGLEI